MKCFYCKRRKPDARRVCALSRCACTKCLIEQRDYQMAEWDDAGNMIEELERALERRRGILKP